MKSPLNHLEPPFSHGVNHMVFQGAAQQSHTSAGSALQNALLTAASSAGRHDVSTAKEDVSLAPGRSGEQKRHNVSLFLRKGHVSHVIMNVM